MSAEPRPNGPLAERTVRQGARAVVVVAAGAAAVANLVMAALAFPALFGVWTFSPVAALFFLNALVLWRAAWAALKRRPVRHRALAWLLLPNIAVAVWAEPDPDLGRVPLASAAFLAAAGVVLVGHRYFLPSHPEPARKPRAAGLAGDLRGWSDLAIPVLAGFVILGAMRIDWTGAQINGGPVLVVAVLAMMVGRWGDRRTSSITLAVLLLLVPTIALAAQGERASAFALFVWPIAVGVTAVVVYLGRLWRLWSEM